MPSADAVCASGEDVKLRSCSATSTAATGSACLNCSFFCCSSTLLLTFISILCSSSTLTTPNEGSSLFSVVFCIFSSSFVSSFICFSFTSGEDIELLGRAGFLCKSIDGLRSDGGGDKCVWFPSTCDVFKSGTGFSSCFFIVSLTSSITGL